jgi:hypothetical protein
MLLRYSYHVYIKAALTFVYLAKVQTNSMHLDIEQEMKEKKTLFQIGKYSLATFTETLAHLSKGAQARP